MKVTTVDGSGTKRVTHINAPTVHKPTVFMPADIPLLSEKMMVRVISALNPNRQPSE